MTDDGGADVVVRQPCFYLATHDDSGVQVGTPSYVEHRFAELPAGGQVIAPQRERLLEITGTLESPVRNIAVVGLTFAPSVFG